jgi:hypothetical protein
VTNQVLSIADIRRQFDSEWVLVIDPELTPGLEVVRGQVAWHSKDRDEVYRKARELAPVQSAILYNGRLAENVAVVI